MTRRVSINDVIAAITDTHEVRYDGDQLTLICRRCGAELHCNSAYHPALFYADVVHHNERAHGPRPHA